MECNQIDWDRLERQIANLQPAVHWITSTSRDQWKRHASGYYPAVAMHQSYKSQSSKSEEWDYPTSMAWKSQPSETSTKPIGALVTPIGGMPAVNEWKPKVKTGTDSSKASLGRSDDKRAVVETKKSTLAKAK
eukprot:3451594-Amphidinium_carterae.1